MDKKSPRDVNEYISGFPKDVQAKLEKLRAKIQEAAPEAEEKISYQMPTFALEGNLVHLQLIKSILGFIQRLRGLRNSKKSYLHSKYPKVRSNFL